MGRKKKISGGKAMLALFTGGLSIPFVGLTKRTSKRSSPRKKTSAAPENIKIMLKQARETANNINTTKNPEVFFGRLGFLFDLLLELKKYEWVYSFSPKPSQDLRDLENGLEKTVYVFIERYLDDVKLKMSQMKTENGRKNKYATSITKLYSAFNCASTFWIGNGVYPHYTGPLYTQNNYNFVKSLYGNL